MKIIDFHTHCFTDDIAERAIARLTKAYQVTPSFDGTISGLRGLMGSAQISASVVVPVATKPSQVQPINDWAGKISDQSVICFGAMHPDFPDPAAEISRMLQMGLKGIKLHPNWQDFRPEDPMVFPIYEAAAGKMIVLFHAGDELEPWPAGILATPKAISEAHRNFPNLTIVAAHMGGYLMWDEVEECLLGTDVYFDISTCFPHELPDDKMAAMIRKHGVEKILFGSDSPCGSPIEQMNRLLSLPLSDDEKEMIAWRNAARLLGLDL